MHLGPVDQARAALSAKLKEAATILGSIRDPECRDAIERAVIDFGCVSRSNEPDVTMEELASLEDYIKPILDCVRQTGNDLGQAELILRHAQEAGTERAIAGAAIADASGQAKDVIATAELFSGLYSSAAALANSYRENVRSGAERRI